MTVAEIVAAANRGNLAGPEMDLESVLLKEIIPELIADVRDASWIRRTATATVLAGERSFALPVDCDRVEHVIVGTSEFDLPYIGDNTELLAVIQGVAERGEPTGWIYADSDDGNPLGKVYFSCALDSEQIVYYAYRRRVPVDTIGDLRIYIPEQFHAALVEGLKREIYLYRWGVGDARTEAAGQKFETWKERIASDRELALSGNYVKSIL